MTDGKRCFIDKDRPCDLTCKAAFEVDDPVDNVDCYFIWLAHHFGEGIFDMKRMFDGMSAGSFPSPPGPGGPPGPAGFGFGGPGNPPKGPKGSPSSN
ncbi:MAG: hypothetical protein AAF682_19465 [Planctomycetota bacterium]